MTKRALVLVLVTALLVSGCSDILDLENVDIDPYTLSTCRPEVSQQPHSEEWPIPRWRAEFVDVYLQFKEPTLVNLFGADYLVRDNVELLTQSRWVSNSTCLDPSVGLEVDSDRRASLTIVQPPLMRRLPEGTPLHNEWNLEITRAISSTLTVNAGKLDGTLDLTGLRLGEFRMTGDNGTSATIRFASLNPEKLRVFEVQTGNSNLTLEGLGNANLEKLTLTGGSGIYGLRFGGDWPRSAEAQIQLGDSTVDIFVPTRAPLRVEIQGELPVIDARNLERESDRVFLSPGFADIDPEQSKLIIRIRMTRGSLTLRWGREE